MNRKRRAILIMQGTAAIVLCAIGIIHDVVNIQALERAAARGEVAARLVPQLAVNIIFAGIALALPALFLLLVMPELGRGGRMARRIAIAAGSFYVVGGIAGYVWQPVPAVLIFCALGLMISVPQLIWRREFEAE